MRRRGSGWLIVALMTLATALPGQGPPLRLRMQVVRDPMKKGAAPSSRERGTRRIFAG